MVYGGTSVLGLPSVNRYGVAGTPEGDRIRDAFVAQLLAIWGDTRLLFVADRDDTTTSTSEDRNIRTITWDATVAARFSALGSGEAQDFDGTDDEGDTPDVGALSFGNSVVDEPFSVVVLCKPDVNNALMTLVSKSASGLDEEYELFLDASGHLNFNVVDQSATARLEGRYAAAAGTAWTLLTGTYDGSGSIIGMRLYTNAVNRAVTDDSSGTYVAMENGAGAVHLGARYTTKARFFNGLIAVAGIVARQLTYENVWATKALINSVYDLAL